MEETYNNVLYQMTKIPTKKSNIVLDERNLFYQKDLKPYLFKSKDINDVFTTLEYLLTRYGKAIYVKILDNKIQDFIPFKNTIYKNTWQLRFDGGFKKGFIDIGDNFGVALLDNFIVRHYDNDTEILWIRDMIDEVCKNREINDCEFFINSERNMPMISLNRSEADTALFGNNVLDFEAPLIQHPVLSFNTSDKFKDIPIPTFYDQNRMTTNIFGIEDFKSMKWSEKEDVFLYRGDSIAYGVDSDNEPINLRLLLVKKLKSYGNQDVINAGITQFYTDVPFVQTNGVYYTKENKDLYPDKDLDIPSKYKFIFVVDGIGHADELSTLMFTGSCLLCVESEYKSWFDELLISGTHYISVSKNLDDLEDKMQWCLDNDEECKKIGLNAREFAVKYLSKNSICDYFQYIFNSIPSMKYESYQPTLSDIQYERQYEYINNIFKEISFVKPLKKVDFNHAKGDFLRNKKNLRLSYGTNVALFYISIFNQHLIEDYVDRLTFHDSKDGVNAVFIGLKCINELCREIPNFSYTYNYYTDVKGNMVVISEKLFNKMSLEDFLTRRPEKSTEILIQIFLAMQLAFERCCFQHGNLSPNNVFVQTLDSPVKIVYNLFNNAFALSTKYVVVITNFSESKALCNFKLYDNKTQRMFVGRYNEFDNLTPNSEKLDQRLESALHVQGSKDVKYLMKKLGRKVKNSIKITSPTNDIVLNDLIKNPLGGLADTASGADSGVVGGVAGEEPIDIMKDVVKKSDILKDKLPFGKVPGSSVGLDKEENPRLCYDKMTGEKRPYDAACERVFSNPLPQEKTVLGNIILQYEITQSLRSTLADLNTRFDVDIVVSNRIRDALNFVRNFYDNLIKNTTIDGIADPSGILENFGIKTLVQKYIKPILANKNTMYIFEKVLRDVSTTILDAIILGIQNTIKFYENTEKIEKSY